MRESVDQRVRGLLRLPAVPQQGRERLVGVATNLFYRHGINAVGLDWILADAGVSKTTFYKHFKSKDEIVVASLEARYTWEMSSWRDAALALVGDAPVEEQLLGLIDVLDVLFNDSDFYGCQFINAVAEFPDPDHAIHRVASRLKQANRDWVRSIASEAGAIDPNTFADHYVILFEGAMVLRQVHGRNDAARSIRPLVEKLIAKHVKSTE